MIYLDNGATSWPKPPEVYDAVANCFQTAGGSPSRGSHDMARRAGRLINDTRESLAHLFHVTDPCQIVFTLNATAAINMALFGLVKPGWRIVTTAVEHNAVARPLRQLEKVGAQLKIVGCDREGKPKLKEMASAIASGAELVIVNHASNVTGVITPIEMIGSMARQAGAIFMVDAAQTAGSEKIDVQEMNIDLLAFTGHKSLLGPQGTGGLYINPDLTIGPLCFGGTGSLSESDLQPRFLPDMLESGTPNTPGIAGLGAGVDFILQQGLDRISKAKQTMIKMLIDGISEIKGITIYGPPSSERRSAVVTFTICGMDSGTVAYLLDRDYGIACRSGLHCAPWAHQVLGTTATGGVRLTPGYFTTEKEILAAVAAVQSIAIQGG